MQWQLIEVEGRWVPADENNESILTIVDEDGTKFAAVYNPDHARLIAAAPAMLAALRAMASEFRQLDLPYGSAAYLAATTAIALAEPTP